MASTHHLISFLTLFVTGATLSGVGWETWNLPLVRRKLSLHVHSVVVNDSGWGVDHIRGFMKNNILFLFVRSLRVHVRLVR